MVELTEKMLAAAATWPVVHEAKKLHEGGRVLRAVYDPPVLKGAVKEGMRTYAAGLRINSAHDMENLCPCKVSQVLGKICAHAVAVALQVMHGANGVAMAEKKPRASTPQSPRMEEHQEVAITIEGSLQGIEATVEAADETARRDAEKVLLGAGFCLVRGRVTLTGQEAVLRFLAEDFPALPDLWKISAGPRFAVHQASLGRLRLRGRLESGADRGWLRLHCEAVAGEDAVPWDAVQRAVAAGKCTLKLASGKEALIDRKLWDDFHESLKDSQVTAEGRQAWRVPLAQAEFIKSGLDAWSGDQHAATPPPKIPLGSLEEVLRPYQKEGVYWLADRAHRLGGAILADDMGLGKTLQTIAFLQQARGPSLVVCPASLVANWKAEARRFWPDVHLVEWIGANRNERRQQLVDADLVITNYAILRMDAGLLASVKWNAVVLDEAQHIKNPESQNAESAKGLPAGFRLALTGTPMENSLRDLWSLGDFVHPGYLGSAKQFQEAYEKPILQTNDRQAMRRLQRKLRPLILRRTKAQVLSDLPPKLEFNDYCEMTEPQADLYRRIQTEGWNKVESLDPQKQGAARKMAMLTLLLRLRQVCCDPMLLPESERHEAIPSAKVELLRELLSEAVDNGRRTLVFSQFSKMLRRLAEQAQTWGFESCYLDGQTRDRQSVIEKFKSSPAIPVFFISLKAGGVGLNLTEADHVIHFDPWWNPSVEDQATDRVHRIGQNRGVVSRKLVVVATVEEKILAMQDEKRARIADFLESDRLDDKSTASLSEAELESLVRPSNDGL